MFMKRIVLSIVFIACSTLSWGQYGPISRRATSSETDTTSSTSTTQNNSTDFYSLPLKDRLVFGGNAGLSVGTTTYIELSPRIGYRVTPDLISGVGVNYIYYNDRYYNYETNIYGGNVFSTYNLPIGLPLALHGEFEMINFEYAYNERDWVPGLNLGAAIVQRTSGGGGIYLMALYNVLYDPLKTYYGSPWVIRISFML